jgi:endonuclease YncB( thermonuclease family)
MKIIELGITVLSTSIICTGIFLYLKNDKTAYTRGNASLSTMTNSEAWQVKSVHDGDTIKAIKDGNVQNFRLCGIDAPEISQPLGTESRDYLRTLLEQPKASLVSPNKKVQISIVGTDRYNRKIGEIFVIADGTEKFINEEMTKAGMAYNYDRYENCPNQIAMGNGEAIAKQKKIGVWGGSYEKPWDYRKSKKNK